MRLLLSLLLCAAIPNGSLAGSIPPRDGWVVIESTKSPETLEKDLKVAVKANKMVVVTQAGPTGAAKKRGITIPANKVIGVFNNVFAVNILATSTAAMIEAPIRFYVTGNEDGSATLSYKTPGLVFEPYYDEGGEALRDLATELDARFAAIAKGAVD